MPAVPKEPLLNASIVLDGVDMSKTANEVNLKDSAAANDVSTFQGGGYAQETPGMKTVDASIHVFQDYTAGSVHATCKPIYDNATKALLVVKADAGPVAADNPAWLLIVHLYEYQAIGAKNGVPQEFDIPMKNASSFGLKEAKTPEELEDLEAEMEAVI